MIDLKKMYADVIAADPNKQSDFEWGGTTLSFADDHDRICVCVETGWNNNLFIVFDFNQKESFDSFKKIYMDNLNILINGLRKRLEPMP